MNTTVTHISLTENGHPQSEKLHREYEIEMSRQLKADRIISVCLI